MHDQLNCFRLLRGCVNVRANGLLPQTASGANHKISVRSVVKLSIEPDSQAGYAYLSGEKNGI
jgi:hypothetical protein